jgi:hypothetical protein
MPQVVQWEEIKDDFEAGSLLLGNGASMAVSRNFGYGSLFEEAIRLKHLTPPVQQVFDRFDVNDFELVLRRLWQAKQVNEALDIESGLVEESYQQVRTALIATIRDVHVSYQDAEPHLEHIFEFMKSFRTVVSLNYDLIVYWAAMFGNRELGQWFKDCFTPYYFCGDWENRREAYGEAAGATLFFYPHGNLVLHRDGFSGVKKITARGMNDLLRSILDKWEEQDLAPAFVCEGTQKSKQESIASCDYLEQVFYEVLPNFEQNLVIFGWSMADQDDHLLKQIAKSCPLRVAISVYNRNEVFMGQAEKKLTEIGVEDVIFFDCKSAGAWNQPSTEYLDRQQVEADAIHDVIK